MPSSSSPTVTSAPEARSREARRSPSPPRSARISQLSPDAVKEELACWFYSLGKVSRLISDYKHGNAGKPDTWFDLGIYAMMSRRLQEVGHWP